MDRVPSGNLDLDLDRDWSEHWELAPGFIYLNHGSFGGCPRPILEAQAELRARLERGPMSFFLCDYPKLLDAAREKLASFLDAAPDGLAFVPNATTGVNTVLRSLQFEPGDQILTTDHEYPACKNAIDFVSERSGADVVVAPIPFPVSSSAEVVSAILERTTRRTRLAVIDHVTSPTGLVLPVERIVEELQARGVDTLVDGAHGPGMLELSLRQLEAAYYTGNCHKWLCCPKGAAFLHVRSDKMDDIRPLVISHGASTLDPSRPRFRLEFDWTGTDDRTSYLSVPTAIDFLGSLFEGGWNELRRRNRSLTLAARSLFSEACEIPLPCPDEMIGSLAAFHLPQSRDDGPSPNAVGLDPLYEVLLAEDEIEVAVFPWPAPPSRILRFSAQLYNRLEHYRLLADRVKHRLKEPIKG